MKKIPNKYKYLRSTKLDVHLVFRFGCQESLASQEVTTETAILHESDLWEEKGRLQKEKARLKEQKNNFEKERKNFTDAAIRLSKEVPNLSEPLRITNI